VSKHNHGFIPHLDVQQLGSGLYEYQLAFAGEVMDSAAGFSSISDAIAAAADITGDIRGFQVSYAGVVVGTYRLETLRATAQTIASLAIETVAAIRND
jgi:hypothetical protein